MTGKSGASNPKRPTGKQAKDHEAVVVALLELEKATNVDWTLHVEQLVDLVKTAPAQPSRLAMRILVERVAVDAPSVVIPFLRPLLESKSRKQQTVGVQLLRSPAGRTELASGLKGAFRLVESMLAKPIGHGFRQDFSPKGVLDEFNGLGAWEDVSIDEAQLVAEFYGRILALPSLRTQPVSLPEFLRYSPAAEALHNALEGTIRAMWSIGAPREAIRPLEKVHDGLGARFTFLRLHRLAEDCRWKRPDIAIGWSAAASAFVRQNPGLDREMSLMTSLARNLYAELLLLEGKAKEALAVGQEASREWAVHGDPSQAFPGEVMPLLLQVQAHKALQDAAGQAELVSAMRAVLARAGNTGYAAQTAATWALKLGEALLSPNRPLADQLYRDALARLEATWPGQRVPEKEQLVTRLAGRPDPRPGPAL